MQAVLQLVAGVEPATAQRAVVIVFSLRLQVAQVQRRPAPRQLLLAAVLGLSHQAGRAFGVALDRQTGQQPPIAVERPALPPETWVRSLVPDTRLLFRFSALTFNAHRIHYDAPYATAVEGYRGLVVHGPLTATLLLDLLDTHKGRLAAPDGFAMIKSGPEGGQK